MQFGQTSASLPVTEVGYHAFAITNDTLISPCGSTLATVKGDLELHRVRFAYPARREAPVFMDFSLQVPQQCTLFCAQQALAWLPKGCMHASHKT